MDFSADFLRWNHTSFWRVKKKGQKRSGRSFFTPHFWLREGDRQARRRKFPTYFPTEFSPVSAQKRLHRRAKRRPFGKTGNVPAHAKRSARLQRQSHMSSIRPEHFDVPKWLPVNSHHKSKKGSTAEEQSAKRPWTYLLRSTKEKRNRMIKEIKVQIMMLSNQASVWTKRRKSVFSTCVSAKKWRGNGCSGWNDHWGQSLLQRSPVFFASATH